MTGPYKSDPEAENPYLAPKLSSHKMSGSGLKFQKNFVLVSSLISLATAFLCVGLMLALFFFISAEFQQVEKPTDAFMAAMAKKDAERAYSLISSTAKSRMRIEDVKVMLEGNNFALFSGYRSISVSSMSTYTRSASTDPDVSEAYVAEFSGTVSYDNGMQGTFVAGAEKEDGVWRLNGINVIVPPSKYGK